MPSTARLLLEVKEQGADATKAKVQDLNKHVEKSQGFFKNAISSAAGFAASSLVLGGVSMAAGFLSGQVSGVIDAFSEASKVAAQTNAVLTSTKGISGMTRKSVEDLADSLSKMSGVDDEVVQSGENMLLTFTNIHKNVFPAATAAALDMSVALGEDMTSASMQLGKALNDPVAGVTALQRIGVKLTEDQKKSVKAFMDVNDVASAQGIILKELQTEFGGSAKAAGDTLPGAMGKLHTAIGNVQEKIGAGLAPILLDLTNKFMIHVLPAIEKLADFVMKNAVPALKDLASWFGQHVMPVAQQLATVFVTQVLPPLKDIAAKVMNDLVPALGKLWDKVSPLLIPAMKLLGSVLSGVVGPAVSGVIDLVAKLIDKIAGAIDKIGQFADFMDSHFGTGGFDAVNKKAADAVATIKRNAADTTIGGTYANRYGGHAMGTISASGGPSWVGESGMELITGPSIRNLAPGSQVLNNRDTLSALGGGGTTINNYNIPTHAHTLTKEGLADIQRRIAVLYG